MGELVFAAKVTHVPSMFISEMPGANHGCRQAAIDGLRQIGARIKALNVDTVIVLDTHWLVNAGYHVNANDSFKGCYTSNEFPHFIQNLDYAYRGNPELGDAIALMATAMGVRTRSHHISTLDVEYGTLVPLRFMGADPSLRVISIAAWVAFGTMEESRKVGEAIGAAIAASDCRVAVLASGSLSHRIHDNRVVDQGTFTISDEFYQQVDLRAIELWQQGRFREFTAMLPTYSKTCYGEGYMHDTAMLLGLLGWDQYHGHVEILTPYFASSGTGQVNAVFPLH